MPGTDPYGSRYQGINIFSCNVCAKTPNAQHTLLSGETIFEVTKKYFHHENAKATEFGIMITRLLCHLRRCGQFPNPHFHQLIKTTPLTIMQALIMIRSVTRSTSRKNSAVRISENNGPVLLKGMTTETLPRSNA